MSVTSIGMQSGLSKLAEAEEETHTAATEIAEQRVLLEAKQQAAEDALEKIAASISSTAERKKRAEELTRKLQTEEVPVTERTNIPRTCLAGDPGRTEVMRGE